jgi:hypothetical protein
MHQDIHHILAAVVSGNATPQEHQLLKALLAKDAELQWQYLHLQAYFQANKTVPLFDAGEAFKKLRSQLH